MTWDFKSALATVSWNEVRREGDFVFMRRGTGETGWWHEHNDGKDYGGNPMDFDHRDRAHHCRTCGVIRPAPSGGGCNET